MIAALDGRSVFDVLKDLEQRTEELAAAHKDRAQTTRLHEIAESKLKAELRTTRAQVRTWCILFNPVFFNFFFLFLFLFLFLFAVQLEEEISIKRQALDRIATLRVFIEQHVCVFYFIFALA